MSLLLAIIKGQSQDLKVCGQFSCFLFTCGRPQCQRLERGYGLANVSTTPCVAGLETSSASPACVMLLSTLCHGVGTTSELPTTFR